MEKFPPTPHKMPTDACASMSKIRIASASSCSIDLFRAFFLSGRFSEIIVIALYFSVSTAALLCSELGESHLLPGIDLENLEFNEKILLNVYHSVGSSDS